MRPSNTRLILGPLQRLYSTTTTTTIKNNRPPLYEILPKKKTLSGVLFDLDSPHSYGKLYPVYESLYKSLDYDADAENEVQIPNYITASDLMIMKKALENVRLQSHSANKHLVALENELTEKAAEYGNNDAVSLLAFETIMNQKADLEDKAHGKKLIAKLLELQHPLTLKLSGDLCVKNSMPSQAVDFYSKFLNVENDTFLASEVYMSLGKIHFQTPDLHQAQLAFNQAIKTGPLDKVAMAHYYLGQIYSSFDIPRARYHFELAASQGFAESFQSLGFMELNVFGEDVKAKEWFKLGWQLRDSDCLVGLFDCCVKQEDWKEGYKLWKQLEGVLDEDKLKHFEASRSQRLKLLQEKYQPAMKQMKKIEDFVKAGGDPGDDSTTGTTSMKDNDRWSV